MAISTGRRPRSSAGPPWRALLTRVLTIVGTLALFLWMMFPLEERIRLGKDLRGGVSLIYHVRIDPNDQNPLATLNQVISVLKERVNPKGILDISMQPLGLDRIAIVMPLPSPKVVKLRQKYQDAQEELLDKAQIPAGELQTALAARTAVEQFGREGMRGEQIQKLQAAYDTHQSAADRFESAQSSDAAPREIGTLAQAVADALLEFEEQLAVVLKLSLERARLERALRLANDPKQQTNLQGDPITDSETGMPVMGPSPREAELAAIAQEFGLGSERLEDLVEFFDGYAAKRRGFDDPEDLMRLLRGAGVLEFRIAVDAIDPQGVNPNELRAQLAERGAANTDSSVARFFEINDLSQWYDTPDQLAALQADPVDYFRSAPWNLVAGERDLKYYLLLYTTDDKTITHEQGRIWSVVGTSLTVDNLGRDAVLFRLDAPGGAAMRRLTTAHVNDPMAIVLDGQVYSAPNIVQSIGSSGIITGSFSQAEVNYLIRVLAAGSLKARLTPDPIAINTLGPSIGEDNLMRGLDAFGVALIAVVLFMMAYYFFAGMVADLALLANGVIIFGFMAMIDGTFTLPGLAGIVLTIGMAVDANVLIYERIREELVTGEVDLRTAIKLGYAKALSTIIDANVTNLIICAVLYKTATTEVKGFALTLSIGICATLFTALFVTRVIYTLYTDVAKFTRLPMLPTVVPAIHRMLEPSIRWVSMRKVFWTVSALGMAGSIALVAGRGVEMFDTEFRGGVAVTMRTAIKDADGEPERHLLAQSGPDGVEARVVKLAMLLDETQTPVDDATRTHFLAALRSAGVDVEGDDRVREQIKEDLALGGITDDEAESQLAELVPVRRILAELEGASVLTVGRTVEDANGVLGAERYQIKVAEAKGLSAEATITDVIVAAIVAEFGDKLDVTRPLGFDGAGDDAHAARTFPITADSLGENIERPTSTDRVSRYLGGVAITIDGIDPPVSSEEIEKRIGRMRSQPDFAAFVGRDVGVFGLEYADPLDPGAGYRSVAVCVYDSDLSYFDVDFDTWDRQLAATEWALAGQALQRRTSLEEVRSFSSAVAATLSANAIVAVTLSLLGIMIYIWVRFGSLRYSLAAIVALVPDVIIALGLLALTAWVANNQLASFLLIEEFRIDLGVVAAMLTIIGYSLNDTIVILDRIRENRGKLPIPTAEIVDRSINQTISRTVLTSTTTLLAVAIMYGAGGGGIRPFAFCLLAGVLVGTYSSVAIAAPLVVRMVGAKEAGSESPTPGGRTWRTENAA